MLLDVATFRRRSEFELDSLIAELQSKTKRSTPAERAAWRSSLPTFARVLAHPSLQAMHLHVGPSDGMIVEYRLPASPSWADVVMLGRGPEGPAAVVVELKDWDVRGDESGDSPGVVIRRGSPVLHPSDQVRGYAEYCQRFHSAVQESNASVSGCVFFTYASAIHPYLRDPHAALVHEYPVFATNEQDVNDRLPAFIRSRLVEPDAEFAKRFEQGVYRQDRGFVTQISAAVRRPETSPFVLLDQQRLGFRLCVAQVQRVMRAAHATAKTHDRKAVVVIHGPPGSGKSVIAAHLWATLSADERVDGNVVLTTTCVSQRTNWEALFERASGARAARGIVIGANQYNPGLSQGWLKREREAGFPTTISDWKENLERFRTSSSQAKCPDNSFAVSIVDEAHALIDPTVPGKEGIPPSGWLMHAGPQAWHIIRASRVTVFLMDGEQSYRDNETTTVGRIRAFAAEFGADFMQIDLHDSQFRCGGSAEYVKWLDDTLLGMEATARARSGPAWRPTVGGPFEFRIADDPEELESLLRARVEAGRSARLVASYARPWRTRVYGDPHLAPPEQRDFVLQYRRRGQDRTWTRVWNYIPNVDDYSVFIQAPSGSRTAADPLSEVGCPYVVRGFDFDYVGLLWMSDLVWREDRWRVQLKHVHESAWKLTTSAARKGRRGSEEAILQRLLRGYRILLTRAIRGTFVWFEDDETRERVSSLVQASSA